MFVNFSGRRGGPGGGRSFGWGKFWQKTLDEPSKNTGKSLNARKPERAGNFAVEHGRKNLPTFGNAAHTESKTCQEEVWTDAKASRGLFWGEGVPLGGHRVLQTAVVCLHHSNGGSGSSSGGGLPRHTWSSSSRKGGTASVLNGAVPAARRPAGPAETRRKPGAPTPLPPLQVSRPT